MKKRILAMLLTVCMVLSMLPMSALAARVDDEPIAALPLGEEGHDHDHAHEAALPSNATDAADAAQPAEVTGGETAQMVAMAQLGTDNTFRGGHVDLSKALYTFTANDAGTAYTVSATVPGTTTTVYLNNTGSSGTQANQTGSVAYIFALNDTENGWFHIKTANNVYVFFEDSAWSNSAERRLNRMSGPSDTTLSGYNFALFRAATASDTSTPDIPGYVKVTEITDGAQYLVAHQSPDGNWYVLYPSNVSSDYEHVAKVVSMSFTEDIRSEGINISATYSAADISGVTATAPSAYKINDTTDDGSVEAAVDGNESTYWHSKYGSGAKGHIGAISNRERYGENYIQLNLTEGTDLVALRYYARGAANGRIGNYEVRVSTDETNWTTVASGTFVNDTGWQIANFGRAVEAQYVRLYATSSYGGEANTHMTAAELRLVGVPTMHTVTFENDGAVSTTIATAEGGVLGERMPADPTKDGETFLGWYTEKGEWFDNATPVTEDVTVHAEWRRTTLVEANANGTWDIEPAQGGEVRYPSEETQGEQTNGRGSQAYDGDSATFWHTQYNPNYTMANTEDGRWIGIDFGDTSREVSGFRYLLRQQSNGDQAGGTVYDYRIEISDSGEDGTWKTIRKGTWSYTASDAQNEGWKSVDFPTVTTKQIRLVGVRAKNGPYMTAAEIRAIGVPAKYNVNFVNGGATTTVSVTHGEAVGAANMPAEPAEQEGKTFLGWYTADGELIHANTPVAADLTATAYWADTALLPAENRWPDNPETVGNISGATASAPSNQDSLGTQNNAIDGQSSTFWHSAWADKVVYDADNGRDMENDYTFTGKNYLQLDLGSVKKLDAVRYLPKQVSGNDTARIKKYTVRVSTDETNWVTVGTGEWTTMGYGSGFWMNVNFKPIDARYVRLYAHTTEDGNNGKDPNMSVAELHAVAVPVTVTFKANAEDEAAFATAKARTNGTVTLPDEQPTKEGYIFRGWFVDDENEFTASTAVTGDLTVTAKWAVDSDAAVALIAEEGTTAYYLTLEEALTAANAATTEAGQTVTLLKGDAQAIDLAHYEGGLTDVTLTAAKNVECAGITVTGNGSMTGFTFKNIDFDSTGHCVSFSTNAAVEDITFDGCSFTCAGKNDHDNIAIHMYGGTTAIPYTNVVVRDCEFTHCGQGVYVNTVNGLTVTGCTFTDIGEYGTDGPAIHPGDVAANGTITITDNTFIDCINSPLVMFQLGEDATVQVNNNTFTHIGGRYMLMTKAGEEEKVTFSGNTWDGLTLTADENFNPVLNGSGGVRFGVTPVVEVYRGDVVNDAYLAYILASVDSAVYFANKEDLKTLYFVAEGTYDISGLTVDNVNITAADELEVTHNDDGTVTVTPKTYVAQIGDTKYETLEAALNAADGTMPVTLLADVTEDATLDSGLSVTLETGDYTVKATVFVVNGTLTFNGKSDTLGRGHEGTADNNFIVKSGAHLIVAGGEIASGCSAVYVMNGDATIQGGTFSVNAEGNWWGNKFLLNLWDKAEAETASITVEGGTFEDYDPANSASENPKMDFVAPQYAATKGEDGVYTVAEAVAQVTSLANGKVKGYASVEAAIAAADLGDTVTVLQQPDGKIVIGNDKAVQLNFNERVDPQTVDVDFQAMVYNTDTANQFQLLGGVEACLEVEAKLRVPGAKYGGYTCVCLYKDWTLTDNVTLPSRASSTTTVYAMSTVTIDLNGYTLEQEASAGRDPATFNGTTAGWDGIPAIIAYNNQTATVKDSSADKTGKIIASAQTFDVYPGATLNLVSGTFTTKGNWYNKDNYNGFGSIIRMDGGTLNIGKDVTLAIPTDNDAHSVKMAATIMLRGKQAENPTRAYTINIEGGDIKTVPADKRADTSFESLYVQKDGFVAINMPIINDKDYPNGQNITYAITGGVFDMDLTEQADGAGNSYLNNAEYWAVKNGEAGTWTVQEKAVAAIGETKYHSLQDAIDAANGTDDVVTLLVSTTESVTVHSDDRIVLNIPAGVTLTNEAGKNTVTVEDNGFLTITGEGAVDNVSHQKAALVNEGTAQLDGGAFTRTLEDGKSNTYYNIVNHGDMIVNGGSVYQEGNFSSLIENGYYNGANETNAPSLIINGGTFSGGLNTVKNDDRGILEINGGAFENVAQAAVLNWNVATINGGAFTLKEGGKAVVLNGGGNAEMDQGKLTITGGAFEGNGKPVLAAMNGNAAYLDGITVSGGAFSNNVNEFCVDGKFSAQTETGKWTIAKLGVISALNDGGSVSGNTVTYGENTTLAFTPDGNAEGRTPNHWWAGWKMTAPEGISGDAYYTRKTPWAAAPTKVNWSDNSDGTFWGQADKSYQDKWATGEDGAMTFLYTFDWDNDGVVDQNVQMIVKNTINLDKGNVVAENLNSGKCYGTLADAVKAAGDGQTVKLLKDASGSGVIVEKSITIDFGGNTYTVDQTPLAGSGEKYATQAFQLLAGDDKANPNSVTMKNGTIVLPDTVANLKMGIQNYTNLTLENMTLDASDNGNITYVVSNNNGDTTFTGSTTIKAAEGKVAFDVYDFRSNGYPGATVTVADATVTVEGAVEVSDSNNVALKISGGTFTADVNDYCVKGYCQNTESGVVGTHDLTLIAEIPAQIGVDGVKAHYKCSICGKLFDLETKEEVTAESLVMPALDGAGKLTALNNGGSVSGNTVTYGAGTTLQFTADGNDEGRAPNHWWAGFRVEAPEGVTERATYTVTLPWAAESEAKLWSANSDGTFWAPVDQAYIDYYGGAEKTLTFIYKFNWTGEEDGPIQTVTMTVTDGIDLSMDNVVAKTGGMYYGALTEAVAAAANGGTVELLKDASGAGVKLEDDDAKTVIIDLGGHEYTVEKNPVGSAGYETQGLHFEKGNTVTVQNGTVKAADDVDAQMLIQNYCDLTLTNVKLEGGAATNYGLSCNAGTTTLTNVSISGTAADFTALDVMHWHGRYDDDAPTMTINNTADDAIDGKVEVYCYGAGSDACENQAELTITGGTFTANVNDYCEDHGKADGLCWNKETGVVGKHNVVTDAAVPATYYAVGWTEGSHCAICGEVFVKQEVIPKLNLASVTAYGGGEVYNNQSVVVTVVFDSASDALTFAADGNDYGRTPNKWWAGIRVADADGVNNATYQKIGQWWNDDGSADDWTAADPVQTDGQYWAMVTPAYMEQFKGEDDMLIYRYQFDWNGDNKIDQTVIIQVKNGVKFSDEGKIAKTNGIEYPTLEEAIAAVQDKGTVELLKSTAEDVVIPAGKDITLSIPAGVTLTNKSGDTIVNNGTLTITGEGAVDNVSHQKAALVNEGTAQLDGGVTLTRSEEKGVDAKNNGGNSYYTVDNRGKLTVNAATVSQDGGYSSLIRNLGVENGEGKGVLEINEGAKLIGGLNNVKNDDYGILTVNGGSFTEARQDAVMNWNVATINGGTFDKTVWNGVYTEGDKTPGKGELTIHGGNFNGEPAVKVQTSAPGTVAIDGGTFATDVNDWCMNNGEQNGYCWSETDHTVSTHTVETVWSHDGDTHWHACSRCGNKFDEAAHTWAEDKVIKAASCEEKGVQQFKCTACGATKTEDIPALGHNLTQHAAVPATCTAEGTAEYWSCKVCGKLFSDAEGETEIDEVETIPMVDHTWGEWTTVTAATCRDKGLEKHICSVCGAEETRETEIDPNNHVGETEVRDAVAATCTTTGYTGDTYCLGCNTKIADGETIAALGHDMKDVEGTAKAPTCTEAGKEADKACSRCDHTETGAVIKATGHNTDGVVAHKAPTCTETGVQGGTYCTVCDHGKAEAEAVIAALGHAWNDGEVTTEATCTTDGVKTFTCTREGCDETRTEAISKTGHTMTHHAAVAATCTTEGNVEYWSCANCNKNFADVAGVTELETVTIAELGHDFNTVWSHDGTNHWHVCSRCDATDDVAEHVWGEGVVTKPATCTETGLRTFTCECGETKTETIDMIDHSYATEWSHDGTSHWHECTVCGDKTDVTEHTWTVTEDPATCTETGLRTSTCECGETKTEVIPVLGHEFSTDWTHDSMYHWHVCTRDDCDATSGRAEHVWGEGVVTTAATCTTDGVRTFTCECGETKTEVIPATGHSFTNYVSDGNATCTTDGTKTTTCDHEGCDVTDTIVDVGSATGHTWDEGVVTVTATCEAPGMRLYTCTTEGCNATKVEAIPATGHDLTYHEAADADCTTAGNVEYWSCANCGKNFADENGTTELENVVIDALGHNMTHHEAVNATCTTEGSVEYWSCDRCTTNFADAEGKTELTTDTVIPALGHDFTKWASDENNHWHVCAHEGCEERLPDEEAAAHTWVNGPVSGGLRTDTCSECGATRTQVVISGGGGGTTIIYRPAPEEDLNEPDVPLAKPFLFTDVTENDWFYEAVKDVFEKELMEGINADGTLFAPYQITTRGAVATLIHRMENTPAAEKPSNFGDVEDSMWYTEAIHWTDESGVMIGYDDGNFYPNQVVTREQLALVLYRYAQFRGYDVSAKGDLSLFDDAEDVSSWAMDGMTWAVGSSLINGRNGTNLAPQGTATRAELATILQRFVSLMADADTQGE